MISIIKAQEIVKYLSDYFQIEEPKVKFGKSNSKRCWYYPLSNEISLGRNHANNDCVLHEFTHGLVKKQGGNPITHGDMFAIQLFKVVDYFYKGKPNKYGWRWDYPNIFKFYKSLNNKEK
jgi:hypothetical protein